MEEPGHSLYKQNMLLFCTGRNKMYLCKSMFQYVANTKYLKKNNH